MKLEVCRKFSEIIPGRTLSIVAMRELTVSQDTGVAKKRDDPATDPSARRRLRNAILCGIRSPPRCFSLLRVSGPRMPEAQRTQPSFSVVGRGHFFGHFFPPMRSFRGDCCNVFHARSNWCLPRSEVVFPCVVSFDANKDPCDLLLPLPLRPWTRPQASPPIASMAPQAAARKM